MVLFIMLYKVILTFKSMDELSVTTQTKAIEQYFLEVSFIVQYMLVLTLESVEEITTSDHSNESY